jgi:hypothetical protein
MTMGILKEILKGVFSWPYVPESHPIFLHLSFRPTKSTTFCVGICCCGCRIKYMKVPFIDSTNRCTVLHCVDHLDAVKYCMHCGFILVDNEMDLFQTFHCFFVKFVDLILDSCKAIPGHKVVAKLEMWKCCNFLGDKTFPDVCLWLRGHVVNLYDYLRYLQSLPHMKLFIQYSHTNNSLFVFVSLQMPFEALSLFNQHNHLSLDTSNHITDQVSIHLPKSCL